MSEGVVRAALDDTLFEENVEISVQSEAAENNDNLNILKEFYFFLEIRPAGKKLFPGGSVPGRRAVSGGGNIGIGELQAIVAAARIRLGSEAGFIERAVEKVARTVACEHSAGSVGSMGAGSQPDDE